MERRLAAHCRQSLKSHSTRKEECPNARLRFGRHAAHHLFGRVVAEKSLAREAPSTHSRSKLGQRDGNFRTAAVAILRRRLPVAHRATGERHGRDTTT